MRCYSRNSTHTCSQWGFNTSNGKASCMLTHVIPLNPKDQDLAGHAMSKLHLISSLTLSKQLEHPRSLSIPTGKHKSEFLHLTLLSFLLRKGLEPLLSLLSNPQSTPQKKKIKLHIISSSHSLKLSTSHTFRFSH